MFKCSSHINQALPDEFRPAADALFPPEGYAEASGPTVEASRRFAEALGVGADYNCFLKADDSSEAMTGLLEHFQNNLDLLIEKTWVSDADQTRKQKLQDRTPGFMELLQKGKYQEARETFAVILDELAYLFFGPQSRKEDFIEYVLRIDPQIGLFWWYGGMLGSLSRFGDIAALRALLLIGVCYLTDF
jgi:hypothetical protein